MSSLIDLRPTEVKLYWPINSDGVFYMNLAPLFDDLGDVSFTLSCYDGPDPQVANSVDINYTIETSDTAMYCILSSVQEVLYTNTPYFFYITASVPGEDKILLYGRIIMKGLS